MTIVKYQNNYYHVEKEGRETYDLQLVHKTGSSVFGQLFHLDYSKKVEFKGNVPKIQTERISDDEEGVIISQLHESLISHLENKQLLMEK